MLRVLIITSLLSGLITSSAICAYAVRRKLRSNRLWTTVVIFGALGLFVSSVFTLIALVRNDDSAFLAGWLWPTSIVLLAGERGDPILAVLVVFGAAILSNIGVYGLVGLAVGWTWNWIRPVQSTRDDS
jgi:hypothetical protein